MVPAHVCSEVALLLGGVTALRATVAGQLATLVAQVNQHVLAVPVHVTALRASRAEATQS